MAMVSLTLPEEELSVFENYAKFNNQTLNEAIRCVMLDKIENFEDKRDLKIIEEYEKEKKDGTLETYSHEDIWGELLS